MMKTMTREEEVGAFNKAADNKTYAEGGNILSHATGFAEEVGELGEAIADYLDEPTSEKRAALVKEWADVQVVLSNLAWFFGINGQVAFTRVHNNNMTKLHDGKIIKNGNGKVLKPEGYEKPDMSGL
jgi:NTP pyrophosphatase (non-canonical NTP hydrolase)